MTYPAACLISYLSMAYLLAKLSQLLTHKLGSPKCLVAGISGCSDIFVINRIAKRKIRFEKIGLELIISDIANGCLGALIFYAIKKTIIVTVLRVGTF